MSKRLQVLLGDDEYREIETIARERRLTVSEWARQALRLARLREPQGGADRKLAAVRAAVRHEFPTDGIERMLEEIERGYTGGES
jgi:hypothetical protein